MTQFEINDYTPEPTAGQYDDAVAALAEAGEGKSLTIRVAPEAAKRQRVLFQRAANRINLTARVVSEEEGADETAITFVLKPRERRGKRASVDAEAAE